MKIPAFATSPVLRKTVLWAGVVIVAFWAAGFLVVPYVAKPLIIRALEEKFHRPVAIRELHINPIYLSARINGFTMSERDGSGPFFTVAELYANLQAKSLWERAPVLEELTVKAPYFKLVRKDDGTYNIADIVKALLKPSEAPTRYSINNIQLQGGRIEFDDRQEHTKHVVSDLAFALPFISNLPYATDIFVKPVLSGKADGAPFHLAGRSKPFSPSRETSLQVDVTDVDVPLYLKYLPVPANFKVPSAKLDTKLSVAFLQPQTGPPTVTLSGPAVLKEVTLTQKDNKPLLSLRQLTVDIASADLPRRKVVLNRVALDRPELTLPPGGLSLLGAKETREPSPPTQTPFSLAVREIKLNGLRLKKQGEETDLVKIGSLALKGGELDLAKRTLTVDELSTADGLVVATRGADGKIDLANLVAPGRQPAPATGSTPPWQFTLKKLAIDGYNARFQSTTAGKLATLAADAIKIRAENLSTRKGSKAKVAVQAQLGKSGHLMADGTIALEPFDANLKVDVKDLALVPLQPYYTKLINVTVTDGSASAKGDLRLGMAAGGKLSAGFVGDASVDRFATVGKAMAEDFLKWRTLGFSRVNFVTQPVLRIDIAEVSLADFYSLLIINPDGTFNLQQAIVGEEKLLKAKPAPSAGKTVAVGTPQPAKLPGSNKPQVRIAKMVLRGGHVDFHDHFIKPNYSAELTSLRGTVSDLSSDPKAKANVALKGRVNNQGRLDINGKINPLAGNLYLDLLAKLRDFELSPVTPYAEKYAGYGITKGKLSFDVKYHVENRKLTAENHLILNQLTFGERVESPTATKLPVLLAVALLKDRNGDIDINLPISGSLDDPKFSMGGIIIKAIVNLIVKAVTAPFTLIGNLFAGGQELSHIEFAYGSAALTPDTETKLKELAKALYDRPALKLDIAGRVDPVNDVEGLKQQALERKVKAQKLKELVKEGKSVASVDEVTVTPEEYPKYLTAAYSQEKIPNKPRYFIGLAKKIPVAEMEKLMLDNIKVSDEDLQDLANRRALDAKDYLVKAGPVDSGRIYIVSPPAQTPEQEKLKQSRVDFSLGTR